MFSEEKTYTVMYESLACILEEKVESLSSDEINFLLEDKLEICEGECLDFILDSPYNLDLKWGDCLRSRERQLCAGKYEVRLVADNCVFEKELEVLEKKCTHPIYFPNAFSPNADGINDTWSIYFETNFDAKINNTELRIFDRWGNMLAHSTNKHFEWEGSFKKEYLTPGIYSFQFLYSLEDSETQFVKSGDIVLIK